MFKHLDQFSLPEIEEKVLKFWKEHHIFEKSVEARKGNGKKFVFFEGPPTANGRPGIHHVLARSFKDIIPRYKTMQGFYVPRRAGWDTHGLPVEIEVEKELGLKQKSEIEKFGIAEFNGRAKDLIWKYRTEWEQLTERMGFWIDLKNPYITYDNSYIESLWWLFSEINKRGYLKKLLKTVPWCFRCQTPLSSHELGQPGAYKLTKDPAVYVKFKIKGQSAKVKSPEYLLAWTTTPWTLPGNLALAVNPKLTYTKYEVKEIASGAVEYLWAFNMPPAREGYAVTVVEKMSGKKLVGLKYEPLYKLTTNNRQLTTKNKLFEVKAGEFVTTEDGSGIVHIAPSFGEEDFKLMGIKEGLPITIDDKARMVKGFPGSGKYMKEADKDIVADLSKRGLLYQAGTLEHDYPYCWRCSNPLIYMVRESWFIEMSKVREKMIKNNAQINWIPGHIKDGRFGEWLKDLKDWAISRNRYWGTPLPIWECQKCAKHVVINGLADLRARTKSSNRYFLVRHGEAQHNLDFVVASGPEKGKNISHLTKKGELQIADTAAELKKEKIQVIFTSPYLRSKLTAAAIAKATKAKVIVDKRLSEINCGIFNWRTEREYHAYFANKLDRFFKVPPSGETLADVRVRMINFIKDIDKKYKGKRIAIVGHGDPLWMLDSALSGYNNEQTLASTYRPTNGGYKEVVYAQMPYNKKGELDMHRPFVDDIELPCGSCKGTAMRIKDVADVWFDSGGMPFAAPHFPFAVSGKDGGDVEKAKLNTLYKGMDFPADYISEAVDQTRGWFYTLLAISTLLDRGISYKNVICLGLIHDKHGIKMSKSKGNTVSPWDMMNKYGVDAIRWYFYTMNDPGDQKNFNEDDLAKTTRRFILILYNSFVFWSTYGHSNGKPSAHDEMTSPTHTLDRWILARLNQLVGDVGRKLDAYAIGEAGRFIEEFTDDLSRWYIRRSRDRFQNQAKGDTQGMRDWEDASQTLRTVLLTLSKVIAPFMPFFAEALYKSVDGKLASVHLENWPTVNEQLADAELLSDVAELRRVTAAALALRADFKLKVRQPLASLTIKSPKLRDKEELLNLLQDEINVKTIKFDEKLTEEKGLKLDTVITPQLREEGIVREVIRTIQGLRAAAKYQMSDEVVLMFQAPDALSDLIQRNAIQIKRAVTARTIEVKKGDKYDADMTGKVDEWDVWFAVRKV